jgi:hypothetical protein
VTSWAASRSDKSVALAEEDLEGWQAVTDIERGSIDRDRALGLVQVEIIGCNDRLRVYDRVFCCCGQVAEGARPVCRTGEQAVDARRLTW